MAVVHLVTGYAGVEHIQAEDDGSFNASFFGTGQYVMESGNQFEGSIVDNNTVRILDGDMLMHGRHIRIKPNTYKDLTIRTGTAGTNRIDLVCMTYEKNANDGKETAYLEVLNGAEAVDIPTEPSYIEGNILEGATKNQMPLYRVTVQGVVLTGIEPVFTTIPTYKALAEKYAVEFQTACETHLNSLNVLDTMEEIQANTQDYQVAGALALKELEKTLKKSVSDGKKELAEAITEKRVQTASTDSFSQMASNVRAIVLGSGNATTDDVRKGKTFTNDDGVEYAGTMVEKDAETYIPSTVDQVIEAGQYIAEAQTIKGDSNLIASNIAEGVTIFGVEGAYSPIIKLGTGTTFDLSGYEGYENLTEDNFIVGFVGLPQKSGNIAGFAGWNGMGGAVTAYGCTVKKTYDASSGKLTIGGIGQTVQGWAGDTSHATSFGQTATVEVYLIASTVRSSID